MFRNIISIIVKQTINQTFEKRNIQSINQIFFIDFLFFANVVVIFISSIK